MIISLPTTVYTQYPKHNLSARSCIVAVYASLRCISSAFQRADSLLYSLDSCESSSNQKLSHQNISALRIFMYRVLTASSVE